MTSRRGRSRLSRRVVGALAAVLVVVSMVALGGCGRYAQLSYRQDHRLTVVAPRSHELVRIPMTLRWTVQGFGIERPGAGQPEEKAGHFAVFVDLAPVKPGQTLRDVANGDAGCERNPTCPGAEYLARRGVYTTTSTQLVLATVAPLRTNEPEQLHEATIVLLDSAGRRIGESAWYVEFKLRKEFG